MTDHMERVQANREAMALESKADPHQHHHELAQKQVHAATEQRISSAEESMKHAFEVKNRNELLAAVDSTHTLFVAEHEAEKHKHAIERSKEEIEKKRDHAKRTNEDVLDARSRKELHDAIDESERGRRAHDLELKAGLAEANRVDYLHGIQEKQRHFQ
jgi:hypothetical protein